MAVEPIVALPNQRMDTQGLAFDVGLDALLTPHDMHWPDGPPADWMLGAPIGNGDFGAVVYGHPECLRFALAKTDVWERYENECDTLPDPDFATFRRTFLDHDEDAYNRIIERYAARFPDHDKDPHLTTCGTLTLSLDAGINPTGTEMGVRLLDATMGLTYTNRNLRALVSRQYDVMMIEFDRGEPKPQMICHSDSVPVNELPWRIERPRSESTGEAMTFSSRDGCHLATQRLGRGSSFTIGVRFVGGGSSSTSSLPGQMQGLFGEITAQRVVVFVTIVSSRESADPEAECLRRLQRAVDAGTDAIHEEHRRWWDDYWMRGLAAVDDPMVQRCYLRSLYLCGSILEPGRQSPGLQGVWAADLHPAWNSDYHANVNIQAVYWGMFTNNRLDRIEPYLRLYDGFVEHARQVARDYFKMRGLRFPHAGSIEGHERVGPGWVTLSVCPFGSVWVAQLLWQYFEYSQDRAFLTDIAYPILRDQARFLVDYLLRDESRGQYTIAPSVHFEALTPGYSAWGTNSLYANAMCRAGFRQAIDAAATLDVDEGDQAEWRDRLEKLAPPPIGADGTFHAFEDRPQTYHSHNFMLPHVFPAELVSAWHGPEEWRETAAATWRSLRDAGEPCHTGGAWCGGQGLCELIRIGEADLAFERARWRPGQPENGFDRHAAGAHIQVDQGPGMCRVLGDMMLLAPGGVIRLFPGIPSDRPARFYSLRAPGGLLISAEKRGEAVDYAAVEPTVDTTLRMANPWAAAAEVTDMADGAVVADADGELIEAALRAGRKYLVAPAGFELGLLPREGLAFGGA